LSTAIVPIPESGQLVTVRGRRWIVGEVSASSMAPDPLRQVAGGTPSVTGGRHHLVTLSSVEDDGLGEEQSVIWEIEPGVRVHEKSGLPDPKGFDEPARLDAFLNAVRWGAVSSADHRMVSAPFRSGIEIEDYQLEPVVRAIQMPRANLLVADDVGLGKTIEAGLVIQEFITRHRARRVLVVCPSSLQLQWRDQMRDKFGLEFRIVDSELLKDLRRRRGLHVNPWTHFPRLITSIDFLKRPRAMRLLREVLPPDGQPSWPRRFDILVLDEAHNAAPSGRGAFAVDSQRTVAIRTIARHFEHRLFLTATPHNGFTESFKALLTLLDDQRFSLDLAIDEKQLGTVMVRRLKSELQERPGRPPRFPVRKLLHIKVPYTAEERSIHEALRDYTASRRKSARGTDEEFAAEFVTKLLKKRLFSCPAAFGSTLDKHAATVREGRRRGVAERPSLGVLRRAADLVEESYEDDREQQEATEGAVETASRLFRGFTPEEERLVKQMRAWAERHSGRPDSKAQELLRFLRETVKPAGKWTDTRVIVFTEYRDTLNWLQGLFAAEGLSEEGRLATLYGGLDSKKREAIKASFLASPDTSPLRILLATDSASEGIDLQRHCSRLVHYEIPWNPNRMEQRNGRVDRYGQPDPEVRVYHFVDQSFQDSGPRGLGEAGEHGADLAGDLEFLFRAAQKLETMERDLFGKVAPVIEAQVEEAMLGRRRKLDLSKAETDAEPVRRILRVNRELGKQVERLHERLAETRQELSLSPENVETAVVAALDLAGQPPLVPAKLRGLSGARVFHLPPLRGSWARCTEGLAHPHTQAIRPITFDTSICDGRDDVVLAHLNHRLVQMSLRLLRAEVWSEASQGRLNRVTARLVPDGLVDAPAVVAAARLVLVGGDGQRLHEEILWAGGLIPDGSFRRLNVGQVESLVRGATSEAAPEPLRQRFRELWPKHRESLAQALQARMSDRQAALLKAVAERAEKESRDIESLLLELEATIRKELRSEGPVNLNLFVKDELEQIEANKRSLEARLARIPAEIEEEKRIVAARYANPQPLLFPAAVVYFVPAGLAGAGRPA
jgi:superfamily II DNA or RNA helicase